VQVQADSSLRPAVHWGNKDWLERSANQGRTSRDRHRRPAPVELRSALPRVSARTTTRPRVAP
jgi:hypothetical protein